MSSNKESMARWLLRRQAYATTLTPADLEDRTAIGFIEEDKAVVQHMTEGKGFTPAVLVARYAELLEKAMKRVEASRDLMSVVELFDQEPRDGHS